MSAGNREAAAVALLGIVAGAYAWKVPPTRRLRLWTDPEGAKANRPVAFVFEGGTETHANTNTGMARVTIEARIFVYTDAGDRSVPGSTQINAISAALDEAMKPKGADMMTGRNTLGGTAYWARREGATLKVPGDIDGDGILVVPIKITLP